MAWISDKANEGLPNVGQPIKWGIDLSSEDSMDAFKPDSLLACNSCGGEKYASMGRASDGIPKHAKVADVTLNDGKSIANAKKCIFFNIDLSGSMNDPVSGGEPGESKIKMAMIALQKAIGELPLGTYVSVRIFGPTTGLADSPLPCGQTALIVPLQEIRPSSRTAIVNKIAEYEPSGLTPMTTSMEKLEDEELAQAEKQLGKNIDATEILITDGMESCGLDPCEAWKECHERHENLKLRIIGLDIWEVEARKKFDCLKENGAKYADAHDETTLSNIILEWSGVHAELYDPSKSQRQIIEPAPVPPYGVQF